MLSYVPGVAVEAVFTVPDENGDNIAGLTWTNQLFKDGVRVTSGAELSTLSVEGVGSPTTGYLASFTPFSDVSSYTIRCTSDQGDVWEEVLEVQNLRVGGAPSYDQSGALFRIGVRLEGDGRLVNCASATALLYRSDDQGTILKNLGAGTEGVLNWFYWEASSVTIEAGRNYFVRVTFTVASPGSPATPVTIVRDLAFLA